MHSVRSVLFVAVVLVRSMMVLLLPASSFADCNLPYDLSLSWPLLRCESHLLDTGLVSSEIVFGISHDT